MRYCLFFLVLLSACTKRLHVKAVHPAKTEVEATVSTISSGTVDAEQQAVLGFGVTGRVRKLLVHLGDEVTEGQLIAELENEDLRISYQEAVKEFGRVKKLLDAKLISRVAYDDSRKTMEVAKAHYDKSLIRAPFAGILTELNLRLGEQTGTTTKTQVPVRLIDQKPRLVKGDIDEIDLARVKVGQTARVRVPAARAEPFTAMVSRVVPYVDTTKEQDRTSQIELRMTTSEVAVPVGASAEIEIVTGRKENVLALPSRLILGSQKQRYLYLFIDGVLKKAKIEVGMGNYERTEIVSGITEADTAVYPSDEVGLLEKMRVEVEILPWP